jgi:hypothetical protein
MEGDYKILPTAGFKTHWREACTGLGRDGAVSPVSLSLLMEGLAGDLKPSFKDASISVVAWVNYVNRTIVVNTMCRW